MSPWKVTVPAAAAKPNELTAAGIYLSEHKGLDSYTEKK